MHLNEQPSGHHSTLSFLETWQNVFARQRDLIFDKHGAQMERFRKKKKEPDVRRHAGRVREEKNGKREGRQGESEKGEDTGTELKNGKSLQKGKTWR